MYEYTILFYPNQTKVVNFNLPCKYTEILHQPPHFRVASPVQGISHCQSDTLSASSVAAWLQWHSFPTARAANT